MPAYVVNDINAGSSFNSVTGMRVQNPAIDYSSPLYSHKFASMHAGKRRSVLQRPVAHLARRRPRRGRRRHLRPRRHQPRHWGHGDQQLHRSNATSLVIGEWSSSLLFTITGTGPYSKQVTGATATSLAPISRPAATAWARPTVFRSFAASTTRPRTPPTAQPPGAPCSATERAAITAMPASSSCWGRPGGSPTFYYLSTGYGSRSGIRTESSTSRLRTSMAITSPTSVCGRYPRQRLALRCDRSEPEQLDGDAGRRRAHTRLLLAHGRVHHDQGGCRRRCLDAESPHSRRVRHGQVTNFSNTAPTGFSTTQQYLIGMWDWNMSKWNSMSNIVYDALSTTTTPVASDCRRCTGADQRLGPPRAADHHGLVRPEWCDEQRIDLDIGRGLLPNREQQLHRLGGQQHGCSNSNQYGWYLPPGHGICQCERPELSHADDEHRRLVRGRAGDFQPHARGRRFIVNTTIPPTTSINTCSSTNAGGLDDGDRSATGGALAKILLSARTAPTSTEPRAARHSPEPAARRRYNSAHPPAGRLRATS